ncbi:N-alpha-acetyltransferase 38, NatC auxiliary subunit [Trichinella papuae]|uniref:U6 snRNA-associated Sm-like protein LSm8 n=1 Tax=Trichinella papuae TaxID=268474 RepID=A0A0V1MPP0_9BILA|nr:N-alpha-acetyltransferase 38, NatC auxiliary subunit [Trichinella papuae]
MCDWLFLSGLLSEQNQSGHVPKGKRMSVQCHNAVNDQREKEVKIVSFVNHAIMAAALEPFLEKLVSIITGDGRHIVGIMKGFDQTINLVLEDSHERVYSMNHGVEQVPLGLYVIRGENIAVVGEIDEDLDKRLDLENIKANSLAPIWTA